VTLVSVITPTWDRHTLLRSRCMRSIRQQTWPEIEHVVVSDGPDAVLAEHIEDETTAQGGLVVFDQLPDHNPALSAWGSRARNRGLELASGEFIAYLDDDNAYRDAHLSTLVDALQCNPGADFAYSQMLRRPFGDVVGSDPPQYGCIDTSIIMHRTGLPQRLGMWPSPMPAYTDTHAPDWAMVGHWLEGGAKWVHVSQVTVDYWMGGT
jgi:glycosyltransferase involved in cell wall biosynthesis